jgi:D-glycero-D-manno-heptose 1,7-bisphosphate phosphatase
MLVDLMQSWPIIRARSFVVTDKESTIRTAKAAGLRWLRYSGGDLDTLVGQHLPDGADW